MLALVTDVIQDKVDTKTLNAAVNAGRQVMKAAEFHAKYGRIKENQAKRVESKPSVNLLTGEFE